MTALGPDFIALQVRDLEASQRSTSNGLAWFVLR